MESDAGVSFQGDDPIWQQPEFQRLCCEAATGLCKRLGEPVSLTFQASEYRGSGWPGGITGMQLGASYVWRNERFAEILHPLDPPSQLQPVWVCGDFFYEGKKISIQDTDRLKRELSQLLRVAAKNLKREIEQAIEKLENVGEPAEV